MSEQNSQNSQVVSSKDKVTVLLLCLLLGPLGAHRFYVGKIGTGLLWLFTIGFFGVGQLIDIINIARGAFKDKSGAVIK